MVYVLNYDNGALMPCCNSIARLLLKEEKAKVVKRCPFTIKLKYQTTTYAQPLTLGIDTGSGMIGSAVVNSKNEVIYTSQIEIRNDISSKMEQRSKYRRNRRNRKTRYRKARWLNRKNSIKKDRFSPTIVSKVNSHLKEINFVKSILPIFNIILETATFDPHLMKNPKLYNEKYKKWGYQKGINYGFANTKAYVLSRDNYTCKYCNGKSKDSKLEVHHIIFKSQRGSDEESNLLVLCKTCHDKLHKGKIDIKKKGKIKSNLKHATQMNSIRTQLLRRVECEETFGFVTKENRQLLGLSKEHYNDAIAIAILNNKAVSVTFKNTEILYKKCVSYRDYQRTKGVRSERHIPTGKIFGFRKFDKVLYLNDEYFIKGRMSTGYAILMGIDGSKIPLRPIPKFSKMKRIGARKSWIISLRTIQSI
jgi:hypothetical protein